MSLTPNTEGNAEFAKKLHAFEPLNQQAGICLFEFCHWKAKSLIFVQLTDDIIHVDLLCLSWTIAFSQLRTSLGLLGKDGLAGSSA